MGAGILPMTIIKNSIFFLLGKEKYSGYWSDFGGSSKMHESILNTAIREGHEELDGFLGTESQLKSTVLSNLICTYNTDRYTTFCFYVDHKNIEKLPYYFNNHREFLDNNVVYNDDDGLFEKNEIKLFSVDDIVEEYNTIRPFYKTIVNKLIREKSGYYRYLIKKVKNDASNDK